MEITIDAMRPDDWESVRAIYEEGLATGCATFETTAPSWEDWNAGHLPFCRLVAREQGGVLGWAALSPASKRQCYAGVAEVSIYIAAAARGMGVGKALFQALIDCSEQSGIWTLQSGLFAVNQASRALHESVGFRLIGYRERVAQRNGIWHDTLLMERRSQKVGV